MIKNFKIYQESTITDTIFKRAILSELDGLKRFRISHIPSIINIAMNKSRDENLTDGMLQVFIDIIDIKVFGGVETEHLPESWHFFWDSLKVSNFLYANEEERLKINKDVFYKYGCFGGICPYIDKEQPYLSYSVDMSKLFDGPYKDIENLMLNIKY